MMRSSFPGGLGSFEDQLPNAVQQGQDDHDQDDRESDQNSGQEEDSFVPWAIPIVPMIATTTTAIIPTNTQKVSITRTK
jgi:hypothetical protein